MALAEKVNNRWVNRRALRLYRQFWAAVEEAAEALEVAQKLAAKAEDSKRVSWSAPKAEDLRAAATKSGRSLQVLAKSGKKWEAELVSREWTR